MGGGTHRVQHLEDVVAGPVRHELEGHERLLVGHPPNGVQNPPNLVRGTAQVAQVGDRLPVGYLGGLRGLDDVARGRLQGQARALLPRPGVAPRAPWGGDVLKRAPPPDGTGRRCPRGRDPARLRHSPRERHGGTDRQKHTPLSASCGGALPSSRSALATPLPSVRARPRLPGLKKQANAPPVLRVFYTEPPSVKIRSAGSAADKALFYKRFQPKKKPEISEIPAGPYQSKDRREWVDRTSSRRPWRRREGWGAGGTAPHWRDAGRIARRRGVGRAGGHEANLAPDWLVTAGRLGGSRIHLHTHG